MPHLLIVRGLPGSGKSTLAKTLGRKHFEADMWRVDENGNHFYDPSKNAECHAACLNATKAALEAGHDVVVSNTFVRRWEFMSYINLGFSFSVVICEGNWQNIHNVPRETIEQMRCNWEWF